MTARAFLLVLGIISAACTHGTVAATAGAPDEPATPLRRGTGPSASPEAVWSDTIRPLETLGKGWNRVPGRFGTGCAHDSAFSFKVRPGLPDKVMIFLNGGGACWRAQDCDPKNRPTYTMTADSANDVAARTGVFDFSNEKNPVRDYTMVFVPYCTGDVHLGSRQSEYEWTTPKGAERDFFVRHGGAANLEAVLDWVYANVKTPRTVFVTGVSAGAIPTPVVAEKIARHYPRARVVQLGDAAGGYHSPTVAQNLWRWGATEYLQLDPGFRSLDSASFTFEQLYLTSARLAPRVHFAQVNMADDATQLFFLGMLDVKNVPLTRLLKENLTEIRSDAPWFHSYIAPGRTHTLLQSNSIYSLAVDKVKFIDWFTDLVDGNDVGDVGDRLLTPAAPKK